MKQEKTGSTFTDADVRNMKTDKRLQDRLEGDGFGVRVYNTGAKVFYFTYTFDGKRRFLNLGAYDPKFETVGQNGKKIGSLAYHRMKYVEAKNKLNKGIDPLLEKDTVKAERLSAPTVSELCSEYIRMHAKPEKKSWQEDERALAKEVIPVLGKRKAKDISMRDITLLLNTVAERPAPIMANRLRTLVQKMFNYAIQSGILAFNPCTGTKPRTETPKDRALDESEIKILWKALDDTGLIMSDQTRRALKLILVTAQRPGEVSGMHAREIERIFSKDDKGNKKLVGAWWTIPAERSKNKRAHRVYLTDMALALIGDKKKNFIFPAAKGGEGSMTEKSLAFALRRNIKSQSVKSDKSKRRKGEVYKRGPYKTDKALPDNPNRIGVEMFTPHDLRRTAATLMAAAKIKFEHRERVLNHSLSKMDNTYNQHDFDDEKQAALQTLESKLNSIICGTKFVDADSAGDEKQKEIDNLRKELEDLKARIVNQIPAESNVINIESGRRKKAA